MYNEASGEFKAKSKTLNNPKIILVIMTLKKHGKKRPVNEDRSIQGNMGIVAIVLSYNCRKLPGCKRAGKWEK